MTRRKNCLQLSSNLHAGILSLSLVFIFQLNSFCQTYTMPTTGLQNTYVGACPLTVCAGSFYDNGGAAGNYSPNVNAVIRTFSSSSPGQCLRATFTFFSMNDTYFLCFGPNSCCDYLTIYDGPSINSPVIYNNCISSPGTVTSTSGSLTFRFTSDGSVQLGGWAATLSCVSCAGGPTTNSVSDCAYATRIYGTGSFANPAPNQGLVAEACAGCSLGETYSHWYKFTFGTGGSLAFDLDPVNNTNDFDFALFGPNPACASLGTPIRCSNAALAGTGNTGMGNGALDNSEDVTGNQWVAPLNVLANETYYLLIDTERSGNSGFILTFTGTAIIAPPLPLKLVSFTGNKHAGLNKLQWETSNEVNTKQFELERSYDGVSFEKIATLQALGGTSNQYQYSDQAMQNARTYYRLRMIDISTSFTYSQVIWINAGISSGIKIYPLPAGDIITIETSGQELINTPVTIYDAVGKLVSSFMIKREQQQEHIGALPPGIYLLRFRNGSVERLVKK